MNFLFYTTRFFLRQKKQSTIIFIFAILFSSSANSQTISGKVTDLTTSEPLVGALLQLLPEKTATISSDKGLFNFENLKPGEYTLQCSYLGYKTVEKKITLTNRNEKINLELQRSVRQIDEITVQGNLSTPVKRTGDALFTGTAITKKGISTMGVSANSSVYQSLDIIPGIAIETNDGYGLSEKTVRIRGVRSNFSGMTIEGFPNYGIMPIGARDDIYDMENMKSISIFKGAAPSDLGTATGSKGGVIELKFDRPADSLRINLRQLAGNDSYLRSFARVDLGRLTDATSAFVSMSRTSANKWKGNGKLGPRYNATLGIEQKFGGSTNLNLYANYNTIDRHHFRKLSFEQTSDIRNTYKTSYNSSLKGDPAEDQFYFDFNQGTYTNKDIMILLSHSVSPETKLFLRTYYSTEDALYNETVKRGPGYFLLDRKRDTERTGVIPEIEGTLWGFKYTLGYWFESAANNANVYNNRITSEGIVPAGYGFYTITDDNSQIHSPYAKIAWSTGRFNLQGGLKYFNYTEPEAQRFTSETPQRLSAEPNPNLFTEKLTYQALLPSFGIGYKVNTHLNIYLNYGKNYMRPYMYNPIISLYTNNMEAFSQQNTTLQDIFDEWTMETSDNIDLGIRFSSDYFSFSTSLFWAKHKDVLTSTYNPAVQLDYFQNTGMLTAYGVDLELFVKPMESFLIFLNPAWNSMSYDENFEQGNETIKIDGNQTPATPQFSIKSGITWTTKRLNSSVFVKHTGTRYGDATNTEKIAAYTIADIRADYVAGSIFKRINLKINLEISNILNQKYVGAIDVSDDARGGSASYFSGAPRSIVAGVELEF